MNRTAVLFVDDESQILAGLRARFYRYRNLWRMAFAGSGEEALRLMADQRFDVIVSDMRMPEMDGAELLREVHARHPQMVRIVLTGQADQDTAMRAAPIAHQFLSKPCDPGALEAVILRAIELRAVIGSDEVNAIVGRVEQLPPFPRIYAALLETLQNDRAGAAEVADLVGQDVAISAKILQLVNSAFFRLARQITRVDEAVAYLGMATVKRLVLAAEVFSYRGTHTPSVAVLDALQEHALWVARAAAALMPEPQGQDDAFLAGLLHDIGKLVLAVELAEVRELIVEEATAGERSELEAEAWICGTTHAEIGGCLLGIWGLPQPIIEAVANHHHPGRSNDPEFGLLTAVHIANGLVNEVTAAASGEPLGAVGSSLETAYLASLGLAHRLPDWYELVASLGPEGLSQPAAGEATDD